MYQEKLPIHTADYVMMKWKRLATWENPKSSGAAVFAANVIYWYLNWTDSTVLNLVLWASLILYMSAVFAQVVFPEISFKENTSEGRENGEHTEQIPESEISFIVEGSKTYFVILQELRQDSPGLFCLFVSGAFMLIWYIGAYVSTLHLMYLMIMAGLLLPITIRKLKKESPWIANQLTTIKLGALDLFHSIKEDPRRYWNEVTAKLNKKWLYAIIDQYLAKSPKNGSDEVNNATAQASETAHISDYSEVMNEVADDYIEEIEKRTDNNEEMNKDTVHHIQEIKSSDAEENFEIVAENNGE